MTTQNHKKFEAREKIATRQACNGDMTRIMAMGCCGTACWYYCEELCQAWEENNNKQWGMHDDYQKYNKR